MVTMDMNQMHAGMAEATNLTRAGRLLEATAAIQRALQGMREPDSAANPAGDIIEGTFWVVEPAARASGAAPIALLPPATPAPVREERAATPKPVQAASPAAPGLGAQSRGHAYTVPPTPRPAARPSHPPRTGTAGGQFISGSYANQAGTRAYKLYIPSSYQGQALPLIVMLHGCTQNPDDFAAGTRMNLLAEEYGCFVVYPAQASGANTSKCWNWFQPADQQRDQGEPSLIAGITRQIGSTYQVDPRRIYVAGLSSGGAMAAIMGMTYPDLYAAVGVHSGLAYGAAHDLPSALAAMQQGGAIPAHRGASGAAAAAQVVPLIVFHGDRDTTVHPRNADRVIAQWPAIATTSIVETVEGAKPRVSVQQGQAPAGQSYTRSVYHDAQGQAIAERWLIHGAGHAWSGGSASGSYTNPSGPDATREMLRFFLAHPRV